MKGFSDSERDRIREELIETGREQFSRFGHNRTRISDLTDAVDIATSTFYQFFDSKEALYLAVLRREQQQVAEGFNDAIEDASDPKSEVAAGFEYFFEELQSNELYYKLIVRYDIRPLQQEASESELEAFHREQFEVIESHVRRWTELDSFRIDDPAEMVGLFQILAFSIAAKESFEGIDDVGYDTAQKTLIALIVNGLFAE
jgi:AcrR family transcriptional regulator